MNKDNRFWELAAKKSACEASRDEIEELEFLLKSYRTDIHYMMNVMEHFWGKVQVGEENPHVLKQAESQKNFIKDLIQAESQKEILGSKREKKESRKFFYWSAAAVIVLCIAIGWFMWNPFQHSSSGMEVVTVNLGTRMRVFLPDGSEVWLNSGSKLIYPKNFKNLSKREVVLSGEGYFEVKHDSDHPFIIHTDFLNIKDLGTVFNIKAYPDEKQAVATLISGSIEVTVNGDPGKTIILKPHEKVSYFADIQGLSLEKNNLPGHQNEPCIIHSLPLHASRLEVEGIQPVVTPHGDTILSETAWVNNELVFHAEKFSQLAERMQRWYNTTIRIQNPEIANYTFTGIFHGETLEQALDELMMIRKFHLKMDKDTVLINE